MSKEKDSVKKERLSMFYKVAPVRGIGACNAVRCLYCMPDTEQSLSSREVEGLRRMRHLSCIKIQQGNRGASESKCPFSDFFKIESCLFLESSRLN